MLVSTFKVLVFENLKKMAANIYVFWGLDFGRVFEGFGEGFGRPKSSVFVFFASFFRCKILNATWKGLACELIEQKLEKRGVPSNLAECAGPGGRIF